MSDDFESGLWGNIPETEDISNATVSISTDYAHSGRYSLKIIPTSEGGYVHLRMDANEDTGTSLFINGIYVRIWIYMTTALEADFAENNGEYIGVFGFLNSDYGVEVEVYWQESSGIPQLMLMIDGDNSPEHFVIKTGFTANVWHCVEIYFLADTDDTDGVAYAWFNGVQTVTQTGKDVISSPPDKFYLGASWWGNEIDQAVYFDDFVMDSENYIGTGFKCGNDL